MARALLLAAAAAVGVAGVPAPASAYELLVFPRAEVLHSEAHGGQPDENEWIAAASVFYAADWRQLRALVELGLAYEHAPSEIHREKEFERAQLGWQFDPRNTLWFGRYHTPIGYWNTAHHHGAHLQTTISRPRIEEFEDEGGILPVHLAGLLWQGLQTVGDGTVSFDIGAAQGPTLTQDELQPIQVVGPQRSGKAAFVARAGWRPDGIGESELGAFAAYTHIPVQDAPADEIRQTSAGAYANADLSRLRLIGEVFWVRNAFRSTGDATGFVSGFLEGDVRASDRWTFFARHESTGSAAHDPYLDRFPDFPQLRTLGGVRFDITHHQAVKLEVARHKRRDGVRYPQIAFQWSTALP